MPQIGGHPASLPCLFSNNCDTEEEKPKAQLNSYQKKRAYAIRRNVERFIEVYGIENCGFFTVTFPAGTTLAEARRRIHNFHRRVLKPMYGEFICILEFQRNGTPHFHLLVKCPGDIRTGFNWTHYKAVRDWYRKGKRGNKPKGTLNRTPLLEELHDRQNSYAKAYGIGRMELVPIRSTAEAVGFYLGGYLAKSLANKPPEAKGMRAVTYSRGFERAVKGAFSWVSPSSWLWRQKLRAWAYYQDCRTMEELKEMFGPRWAFTWRETIMDFPLNCWPTKAHLLADRAESAFSWADLPDDAENITRSTWKHGKQEPDWQEESRNPEPRELPVQADWGWAVWKRRVVVKCEPRPHTSILGDFEAWANTSAFPRAAAVAPPPVVEPTPAELRRRNMLARWRIARAVNHPVPDCDCPF